MINLQLACKVIEHSGGIQKVDYDKISETWPCEKPNDRPGVATLKKQITVLRKITSGDAGGSSAPTPRTAAKNASRVPPKTPTKRTAPKAKTPASKKRKMNINKRKHETDDSEIGDITSSDEDPIDAETTEDEGIDVTPKDNRRILPARPRNTKSKSYAEDSDSDSKNAGARTDSEGDDDFDPAQEKEGFGKVLPQKKTNLGVLLANAEASDDDEDKKVVIGDDAKSVAASHASFKSAQEDIGDEDDEDDNDGY